MIGLHMCAPELPNSSNVINNKKKYNLIRNPAEIQNLLPEATMYPEKCIKKLQDNCYQINGQLQLSLTLMNDEDLQIKIDSNQQENEIFLLKVSAIYTGDNNYYYINHNQKNYFLDFEHYPLMKNTNNNIIQCKISDQESNDDPIIYLLYINKKFITFGIYKLTMYYHIYSCSIQKSKYPILMLNDILLKIHGHQIKNINHKFRRF